MSATNIGMSEQRPIDRFEFGSGIQRQHWVAIKTPAGRLIAAGNHGLVELVGAGWSPASIGGDYEWESFYAGADGRIWAGANGEIGVFEPTESGSFQYRSLTGLLPGGVRGLADIWNVLSDESGRVIFVSSGLVVRTDGNRAEVWHIPFSRRLYGWTDGGRVFVSGAEGQVFIMEEEGPRTFPLPAGVTVTDFAWGERMGQSDWIGLCETGIMAGDPRAGSRFEEINRILRTSAPNVPDVRVRDGRLAIPTYRNGLFLVDTDTGAFEHLTEQEGLLSLNVPWVFHGDGDWLWAVTTRGLNRLSISKAISFVPNGGGLDGAMIGFVDVAGDSAFVATQSGRFEVAIAGREVEPRKVSDNRFLSQAKFGSKYLGGTLFGVFEFDQFNRRKVIPVKADVSAIVAPSSIPNVAFFSEGGDLRAAREHDGEYEIVASESIGGRIDSMIEDGAGDLWIAVDSEVKQVSFAPSGDRFIVRDSFRVSETTLLRNVATELFRIDGKVFLARGGSIFTRGGAGVFEPVPLFQNAEVLDVTAAGDSESWALVRPRGHDAESPRLARLSVESGTLVAEENATAGLLSAGHLRNVHSVTTGPGRLEVWIGADKGIIRLRPEGTPVAGQGPALQLSMTRIDEGKARTLSTGNPKLPHGHESVSFSWAVPGAVPRDMFVETRIAGADGRWVAAENHAAREFSGLGDGAYAFEARTVDAFGRPGPVSSVSFVVLPPWYRTPGAISGYCIAVLLFGAVSWQLRIRVARRRAEELEALVESRTRELERVNAEKSRFIAQMNHEIRNPLNGLLGAIAVLEQFKHSGREGRMVEILRACADHLGAVVEDVLDFSNIEGGRITVMDRAFSIAAMVESVPRMMLAESERTGTEVVTTISPGVPDVVVADPDKIRQILVNFLGNALKFAPGEPVHMEVGMVTMEDAPWLRFAVRDHGPGISEADKKSLFTMFERGRSPARRKMRGMGIGLATCRLLARRMGGEVGVISGLGEGSEFFLRLPLKVDTSAIATPETGPQAELHRLACLLVEDQEFNRVILKDMLERAGCTVDEAADAESALNLAARNRYDVVFTDLELPDAAPGEILKMLKDQQATAKTPVPSLIVTTAYATENVRQTCLAAGAAAFLAKPLSVPKVLSVLRQIDAARRPASSVEVQTPGSAAEPPRGVIFHLARIRGSSVESVAVEVAANVDDEAGSLRSAVAAADTREVAQRAHRLLSLAALADAPDLAAVAAGIQGGAREGRLPAPAQLDALASAIAAAKAKLASFSSGGPAGARSRAPGRSEPTASSRSD